MIDSDDNLHLFINGIDQGIAAENLGSKEIHYYGLLDLYGQCEEASILASDDQKAEVKLQESLIHLRIRKCEYLELARRFKKSLVLPKFYAPETPAPVCFCSECFR